jgi:DNA-binding XRE family transcriptional regulator
MTQEAFAARLRVLRAERKLTLRDAERLTGVDKDTLSKIERGIRRPHDVTLAKIAEGYGVPVEDLLEVEVPKVQAPPETSRVEERRAREHTLVFYVSALAERFEEYLAGIERGEYAPGEPRHEDLLAAYGYVDWSVDDARELRGVLSPEFTDARERLWRAHRNLTQKHVDYGDPGTTAADADLRSARRPRPQDEPGDATGTTA